MQTLGLAPQQRLLDVACGPGLYAVPFAQRGLSVHGVDFSSVALGHARQLAADVQVTDHCHFTLADMRTASYDAASYDAALLIYGQLAVMTAQEAQTVLTEIYAALRPGGKLCLELLNPKHADKKDSTWWFTDDGRLWGDEPYLHLGERMWDAEQQISTERFQILHLDSGQLDEIILCDQVYSAETLTTKLTTAGFSQITVYPEWDNIGLYDEKEWLVYIATK